MQTRWQQLFADLEAQAAAAEKAERASVISDRTRGELARIILLNRLRAQMGHRIELRVSGVAAVVGSLRRVGVDWILVSTPDETVVMVDALVAAVDLPPAAVSESGVDAVTSRVGMGAIWRAIARDRSPVSVQLRDGSSLTGTPDRVGADFVDLACHALGEVPRGGQVASRWTLSWSAVAVVSRPGPGGPS